MKSYRTISNSPFGLFVNVLFVVRFLYCMLNAEMKSRMRSLNCEATLHNLRSLHPLSLLYSDISGYADRKVHYLKQHIYPLIPAGVCPVLSDATAGYLI